MLDELNEIAEKAGVDCAKVQGTANDLQSCLDVVANTEAKRLRPSLVRIILLHGLAALLAATVTFQLTKETAWEKWKWIFTGTELLMVTYALWLSYRLHRKHTQKRWIRCRFACEIVRGLRACVPLVDPLHPTLGVHDPLWRRFALSAGLLVNEHQTTADLRTLRDSYIAIRLSETDPEGQILHYRKMQPRAERRWWLTGKVSKWSALLAPPFVLLSLINKLSKMEHLPLSKHGGWHLDEDPRWWPFVVLLPIALPLIAGVANGIRQALDAGRRKERYPEMAARLISLRSHLAGLETRSTITHTVAQTEEILLDELREWQLTATTTGH